MTHLILPVSARDRMLGTINANITLVEYGNYECSHCAQVESTLTVVRQRLNGALCSVYRHFPSMRNHKISHRAAEAAEAAAVQGKFWEMHRLLFEYTHHLDDATFVLCATTLGLDMPRFLHDMKHHTYAERVCEDFESGLGSGVNSTPTFYINGIRHDDYWDADTLLVAMESSFTQTKG